MGWESQCGQRPGTAAALARSSATTPEANAAVFVPANNNEEEDDAFNREWNWRKFLTVGFMFIVALWLACFTITSLLVHALIRVTEL